MTGPIHGPERANWEVDANCLGLELDAFFGTADQQQAATTICQPCTVRNDCLNYALTRNMEYGVWGGHTQDQLHTLRRRQRRARSRR